jgi:hypothetical protein
VSIEEEQRKVKERQNYALKVKKKKKGYIIVIFI